MRTLIPAAPKKGEPITAAFLESVVQNGNLNMLSVMAPLFIKSQNEFTGTCIGIAGSGEGGKGGGGTGSGFRVYADGTNTGGLSSGRFGITGGNIVYPTLDYTCYVADVLPLAMAIGTKIWVEFDGAGLDRWNIGWGAEWPVGVINISLATIIDAGSVSYTNGWQGGNIILPEIFPVNVVGTYPPSTENPPIPTDPVYTVTTLGGINITTLIAGSTLFNPDDPESGQVSQPQNYRDAALVYKAGSLGIAWFTTGGYFDFFVFDEYVDHETVCVGVVTGVDDSTTPPCYTITPMQYSMIKLKKPEDCPLEAT